METYIQYDTVFGLYVTSNRKLCKFKDFSRPLKDFPTVFKGWKLSKNTDLHIKILLQKC